MRLFNESIPRKDNRTNDCVVAVIISREKGYANVDVSFSWFFA